MKSVRAFVLSLLVAAALVAADAPKPPVAKRIPKRATFNGDTRTDEYGWLREKQNKDVLSYLKAENAYTDAIMKPTLPLQQKLYDEMLSRIQQTDSNVPYRQGDYFYYSRFEAGKQYPIYARKKKTLEAPEEITLDLNAMSRGLQYLSVNAYEPSDDGTLLAYSLDKTGYREYELHIRDLRSGQDLPDTAAKTYDVKWGADNQTLFYTVADTAKRQYRIYRHKVGGPSDELMYEEKDELYDVSIDRSRDGQYLFFSTDSKRSSEVRYLAASEPDRTPRLAVARTPELKYSMEHRGDRFYFRTNDAGINYRIATAPVASPDQKNWVDAVPYRKNIYIVDFDLFANYLVVRERENGLSQLEVVDLRDMTSHRLTFPEPAYAIASDENREFDTDVFRYRYQSMVTPLSVYDYDMAARKQTLLKRTAVLGGFDPANYASERIFATASDGAKVPIALVYRKGIDLHGVNPLLLYGYGSYGVSIDDSFSSNRLSLLDRGVVYAIAHIRGGGEMGKEWHEQGRMMSKKNTFTDFIAAAEHLIREKYTSKEKLVIQGGSAGGLLMGAVTNMRPDLFHAVVAQVPFVDVMNTMLDPSVPLTVGEYLEWGNPNEVGAYGYMKSYDPYSNIARKNYPAMLVRTSLNDSQVGYWEGTKYVARLRTMKTDRNPLLLKVNMGAGHGGSSGRYDALHDVAFDYAFMLTELGIKPPRHPEE